MKFFKLAKSDKFEYMMLSRLIQDAKYFIEHPDLKHLWAKTLDEHINKMLEQYTKLDPKPEWTSEEEINNLAKQMKESYTNRWNEVHPDNKIEANNYYKINDNFKVDNNFKVGDRVFYDPFYEFKDGEEGSFYDNGILREIKNWPSDNREYYMVELENGDVVEIGNIFHTEEEKDNFHNNWMNPKFDKQSKKKDKEYTILYRSEKEREADSDFHIYKALKDKKRAIELAKDLFKKMNYEGEVNVASGDYSYYSTDNYDWDKINKMNSKDYKNGYRDGKDDYEIGHPADPDDLKDDFSEEYIEGYWQGFNDAQEKEFYKQSAITQPNKPKPTTMLPDNMQWAWDPDAADWIAVLKDNDNTTPPLYDPQNQNLANNNATTYMNNIKSASVINGEEDEDPLSVRLSDLFLSDSSLVDSYIKNEINCDDILNILGIEIKNKNEYKEVCNYVREFIEDNYMSTIKSASCLSEFLDGPRYSKEIKIESGLIKDDLVKYAGFDFNKGTKYAITTKGLEVLRKASEAEHNEAQNEREKLAYLFGFNTDDVSTLDTTGKVIKSDKKYTICEADGTELGEVEADSELDAKVKFGIEHPEYADSLSICAKEIKAKKLPLYKQKDPYYSDEAQISLFKTSINDVKRNFEQIAGIPLKQFCLIYKENNNEEFKKIYDKITDYISKKYNYNVKSMQWFHSFCDMIEKQCNKKDAQYEQTTNTKEPYPNPSETPHDDIILENHTGWVNTAEQKVTPEFAKLHELLGKYKGQNLIQLADVDGNLVASGDPQIINNLEHEVKDIGYYCESISEDTDSDYAETYSLKIFMK